MHEAKHTRRTKSVLRGGCPREVSKGFQGRIRTQPLQILLKIIGNGLHTTCIEVSQRRGGFPKFRETRSSKRIVHKNCAGGTKLFPRPFIESGCFFRHGLWSPSQPVETN